jgi:hypothetical protein
MTELYVATGDAVAHITQQDDECFLVCVFTIYLRTVRTRQAMCPMEDRVVH